MLLNYRDFIHCIPCIFSHGGQFGKKKRSIKSQQLVLAYADWAYVNDSQYIGLSVQPQNQLKFMFL